MARTPGLLKIDGGDWLLHPCHWKAALTSMATGRKVVIAEASPEDAARLVLCWNSHDALVEALKRIGDEERWSEFAIDSKGAKTAARIIVGMQEIARAALDAISAGAPGPMEE